MSCWQVENQLENVGHSTTEWDITQIEITNSNYYDNEV